MRLASMALAAIISSAALLFFYVSNAPVRAPSIDDISYMEIYGGQIDYQVDLYNSITDNFVGRISDTAYIDERLNFDLFVVPCDKEIGDLCEDPPLVFWARYMHQKEPISLRSMSYFTPEGGFEMQAGDVFFGKLKNYVFEHFCRKTNLCTERKKDGNRYEILDFNLD